MSTATKTLEAVGFTYDGSFPADFLCSDEQLTFTGNDEGHCVIVSSRGHVRLKPGDLVTRRPDGALFTTSSPVDTATGQGRR